MSTHQPSNDEQILNEITARAATDRAFRQRLISAPEATITEVTGVALPAQYKVKFVEKDAGVDAMFVLPDLLDPNGELSAEELESVAGGVESDCWFTCGNTCQGCSNSITTESA